VAEKIPFFCAVRGDVRDHADDLQGGREAIAPLQDIPVGTRMLNVIISYAHYIVKLIWPAGLSAGLSLLSRFSCAGSYWSRPLFDWRNYNVGDLEVGKTKALPARRLGPGTSGTLVPVIGVVQVGQSFDGRQVHLHSSCWCNVNGGLGSRGFYPKSWLAADRRDNRRGGSKSWPARWWRKDN